MHLPISHRLTRSAVLGTALAVTLMATPGAEAQKQGTFAGVITNQAEEPLDGVAVTMSAVDDPDFTGTATTDKKGKFSIKIPTGGDYLLRLEREGYAPFEETMSLEQGQKLSVNVAMLDLAIHLRKQAIAAYNEGSQAYRSRAVAKAKESMLAATAADPTLPEPYLLLADIHLGEGDAEAAAAAVEKFLELQPGDRQGQFLAYKAYRKLGNQAKVDELLEILGATDLAPQLALELYNDGALASQKGDLETAVSKLESALGLDPDLVAAQAALATIYYNQKRHDEALAAVDGTLALEPGHVASHRLRYFIQDALGDRAATDEALAAYGKVDPKAAAVLIFQRADTDYRGGKPQAAEAGMLRVLELDPDMPRAHYTLGLIYAAKDKAKAKAHLERFIELAPDDPEVAAAKEMIGYF